MLLKEEGTDKARLRAGIARIVRVAVANTGTLRPFDRAKFAQALKSDSAYAYTDGVGSKVVAAKASWWAREVADGMQSAYWFGRQAKSALSDTKLEISRVNRTKQGSVYHIRDTAPAGLAPSAVSQPLDAAAVLREQAQRLEQEAQALRELADHLTPRPQ